MCVCVCLYVRMYVRLSVCLSVCMYVCMYVRMYQCNAMLCYGMVWYGMYNIYICVCVGNPVGMGQCLNDPVNHSF